MASTYPSINDREFDLLKKIANNTALIADDEVGDVASITGTANQVLVNGGTAAATGAVTVSLPATAVNPAFSTSGANSETVPRFTSTGSLSKSGVGFFGSDVVFIGNDAAYMSIAGSSGTEVRCVKSFGFSPGVQNGNDVLFTRTGSGALSVTGTISFQNLIKPQQATTVGAPAYQKGAVYFDTTLNKLRVGGATGWETVTSV